MATATAVSICSNALLMLGAQTINDFNEDNDRTKLASNLYPMMRDALLRSRPWNTAVKRVILAPHADAPAFDYQYQFAEPDDWLKTLQVGEYGTELDFRHEGRMFLCDNNVLPLRYIFRNEVEASWDSLLVYVMTLTMAAAMAYGITKSAAKEEVQWNLLRDQLRSASAVDGQDDPAETLGDFRLVASRYGRRWP